MNSLTYLLLLLLLAPGLMLAACDAGRGPVDLRSDGSMVIGQPPGPGDPAERGACATEPTPAPFDFHVSGEAPAAWEGRVVTAAAIENDVGGGQSVLRRPVLMSATIKNGAFLLHCPHSLHENLQYPSWALFVDMDGDGRCTVGDLGFQMALYAWLTGVDQPAPSTTGWPAVGPMTGLRPPIGSTATSFCSGYFF